MVRNTKDMNSARLVICLALAVSAAQAKAGDRLDSKPAPLREQAEKIVAEIQRADYEGNRDALRRLFDELAAFTENKDISSRIHYWRGFALWRRALNGFNDSVGRKELEADLEQAVSEFDRAGELDPHFVDAKIGALSCISNLIFLNRNNPARVQELVARATPLRTDALTRAPNNPRLLWVLGPILWYAPADRGGSQAKAIETYQKGLEAIENNRVSGSDRLEPSWGKPELLMNLAWSNLHKATPDLSAARQYAHSALDMIPYWHYVRDLLLPEIENAEKKQKSDASGELQKPFASNG